jgi:hypothetical protein
MLNCKGRLLWRHSSCFELLRHNIYINCGININICRHVLQGTRRRSRETLVNFWVIIQVIRSLLTSQSVVWTMCVTKLSVFKNENFWKEHIA